MEIAEPPADAGGTVDYFYLHEIPQLSYVVVSQPPPADSSKAEFRIHHATGKLVDTDRSLKREGGGVIPWDPKKHGVGLAESPIFVKFTFTKGNDVREHFVVISLAEPAVRAIAAQPEAYVDEHVPVRVTAWDALAWDLPGLATVLEEKDLSRLPPDTYSRVRWWLESKKQASTGTPGEVVIEKDHLGKTVTVQAYLGDKLPKKQPSRAMVSAVRRPWADVAWTTIVVPKLTIEGDDELDVGDTIPLHATIEPAIEGTYAWFDAKGAKLGSGWRDLEFLGKTKSKTKGDQPVECRFTSKATGRVYTAKHPLTVNAGLPAQVPIGISHHSADETATWLARNPIEVRLDDRVISSHSLVDRSGRIVVSFHVKPGDHTLVVSSAARNPAPGRPKLRIVHLSQKITVTATDSSSASAPAKDAAPAPTMMVMAQEPQLATAAPVATAPATPSASTSARTSQEPPDDQGGLLGWLKSKIR